MIGSCRRLPQIVQVMWMWWLWFSAHWMRLHSRISENFAQTEMTKNVRMYVWGRVRTSTQCWPQVNEGYGGLRGGFFATQREALPRDTGKKGAKELVSWRAGELESHTTHLPHQQMMWKCHFQAQLPKVMAKNGTRGPGSRNPSPEPRTPNPQSRIPVPTWH